MVPDPTPTDELSVRRGAYAHYFDFKSWSKPFSYDAEQAASFAGELGTRDLEGRTLLEIGFGEGGLLAWARDHGAKVAGIELNPQSLDAAAEQGIELLPPDLAAAAAAHPARFDYIVAFDVFEHLTLPEIIAAARACAAMLKPDGTLLLRFPNAQSPFGLAPQYADLTHVTPLSGEQLRQLVAPLPLEVISVAGAWRGRGRGLRFVVRSLRYLIQDMIALLLRFAYVNTAPMAPVVTARLRRKPAPEHAQR